jgi:hypothetical protein
MNLTLTKGEASPLPQGFIPRVGQSRPTRSYRSLSRKKIRDCIRIAALLRERVLRLAFDCKKPSDAEFTLT